MITYYAACSLDYYLAGPKGELDWLPGPGDLPEGDDLGYKAFYDSQDLMVMGYATYQICLDFGQWYYADKENVVLTRKTGLTPKYNERFEAFDPELWKERSRTKKIYLNGGGEIAKLFLEHGLIDRLSLALIPKTLGSGIPLIAPGAPAEKWTLVSCRTHPSGIIQAVHNKA